MKQLTDINWKKTIRDAYLMTRKLDRAGEWINPRSTDAPLEKPESFAYSPIRFGMWTIIIVFGIFGLWAALAPLDSAAIANGQVVLDSNRKTIQHLEGGEISEILVREGELVKKDQPLIRMNPTAAKSRFDLVKGQYNAGKATEARLIAERDSKDLVFPAELEELAKNNAGLKEILQGQRNLFETRRSSVSGSIDILNQKIAQSQEEIEGLNAQMRSTDDQIKLLEEEIATVEILLKQGNASKPRLLALQRSRADIDGQRGEYKALIARAQQRITESKLEINNTQNEFINKVNEELKQIQQELADQEERIRASEDIFNRVVIASPSDGIITGLQKHTQGGVISPGEKLMDIVPLDDKLIIEAKVSPMDIDVVHPGLETMVQLTAYKTRTAPKMEGRLTHVSPDSFTDDRSGATYFVARIEISKEQLDVYKDVKLLPGMPATVFITVGERSLISYLFTPITDSISHAFREQ